jgi:hypothetical protein
MLEFVAGILALVVGAVALLGVLVVLPILLIGGLLKLLFGLILLPFRLLGVLLGAVAVVFALLFKVAFVLFLILAAGGVLAGGTVLLAIAPFILLGLGVWLLIRLARSGSSAAVAGV